MTVHPDMYNLETDKQRVRLVHPVRSWHHRDRQPVSHVQLDKPIRHPHNPIAQHVLLVRLNPKQDKHHVLIVWLVMCLHSPVPVHALLARLVHSVTHQRQLSVGPVPLVNTRTP
jgi:hypothetical protein